MSLACIIEKFMNTQITCKSNLRNMAYRLKQPVPCNRHHFSCQQGQQFLHHEMFLQQPCEPLPPSAYQFYLDKTLPCLSTPLKSSGILEFSFLKMDQLLALLNKHWKHSLKDKPLLLFIFVVVYKSIVVHLSLIVVEIEIKTIPFIACHLE